MKQLLDSEIRIGNLVLDSTGNTTIVESIIPQHERVRFGIPLTEEWLLKFGFYEYGSTRLWKQRTINVKTRMKLKVEYKPIITINTFGSKSKSEYKQPISLNTFPFTKVYFVHQLQNLHFALTGIELELK